MNTPMRAFLYLFLATLIAAQSEWLEIAPAGKGPTERRSHASAFLTSALSLVTFGGESDQLVFDDTWFFGFSSHQWTQVISSAKSPSSRVFSKLVAVGDNTLLLFGGIHYFGSSKLPTVPNDLWSFTGTSGWNNVAVKSTASQPKGRFGHSSVSLGLGIALFFGGAGFDSASKYELYNDVWVAQETPSGSFNWSLIAVASNSSAPSGRAGHSAVTIDSQMLIFGGTDFVETFDDLWSLDPKSSKWTLIPTFYFPSARAFHGACSLGLNMVVYGGEIEDATKFSSETWLYDSFNKIWKQLNDPTAPIAGSQMSLTELSSSVCISFGGISSDRAAISSLREITSHPTDAKWSVVQPDRSVGSSPDPRELFAAAVLKVTTAVTLINSTAQPSATQQFWTSQLWVLGGRGSKGKVYDDIWSFDVPESKWSLVTLSDEGKRLPKPGPHFGAKAVAYNHFIILCGGTLPGSALWAFNRQVLRWTQITPTRNAVLLQRIYHQISLVDSHTPAILVDGGQASGTGVALGDILSVPLTAIKPTGNGLNSVFEFNGLGNYVTLWSNKRYTPSSATGMSLEAMFLLSRAETDGVALLSWAASNGNYMNVFYEFNGGNLCVGPDEYLPENAVACGTTRVDDDRWHHVFVSFGPDSAFSIFIDGKLDNRVGEQAISLDYTVEIDQLVVGTAFPSALPYLITTQGVSGLEYRRVNDPPYWAGYIDCVRVWPFASSPAQMGYFPDNVTFPVSANKSAALGYWDFDVVTASLLTPDDSGVSSPAASVGTKSVFLSRPISVTWGIATRVSSDSVPWVTNPVEIVFDSALANENTTACPPRYQHASAMIGSLLFVFGGRNATDTFSSLWQFNTVTLVWTLVELKTDTAIPGVVLSTIIPFTDSYGPSLAILAGMGEADSNTTDLNVSKVKAISTVVRFDDLSVESQPIIFGHGMNVEMSGHFAGILPNSSMIVIFGGELVSNDRISTDRAPCVTLSNRLFSEDLSNPGSPVIAFRVLGDQPTDRLIAPFALLPKGEALGFDGSMGKPLWSFNFGLSTWKTVLGSRPDNSSENEAGYALVKDESSEYHFVGHHCETYDWRAVATDERCSVGAMVYTLDSVSSQWNQTQQQLSRPSEISTEACAGGVLSVFPQFCSYDGTYHKCSEAFLEGALALTKGVDSSQISVASLSDGTTMAVWTYGYSIRGSMFDGTSWGASFSISEGTSAAANSNPRVAFNPKLGEWFVVFSTTSSIRNSGVDSDLVITRSPYPTAAGFCENGQAVTASLDVWYLGGYVVQNYGFAMITAGKPRFVLQYVDTNGYGIAYTEALPFTPIKLSRVNSVDRSGQFNIYRAGVAISAASNWTTAFWLEHFTESQPNYNPLPPTDSTSFLVGTCIDETFDYYYKMLQHCPETNGEDGDGSEGEGGSGGDGDGASGSDGGGDGSGGDGGDGGDGDGTAAAASMPATSTRTTSTTSRTTTATTITSTLSTSGTTATATSTTTTIAATTATATTATATTATMTSTTAASASDTATSTHETSTQLDTTTAMQEDTTSEESTTSEAGDDEEAEDDSFARRLLSTKTRSRRNKSQSSQEKARALKKADHSLAKKSAQNRSRRRQGPNSNSPEEHKVRGDNTMEGDVVYTRITNGATVLPSGRPLPRWETMQTNLTAACSGRVNITGHSAEYGTIGTPLNGSTDILECSWSVVGGPGILRYDIWIRDMPSAYFWIMTWQGTFGVYDGPEPEEYNPLQTNFYTVCDEYGDEGNPNPTPASPADTDICLFATSTNSFSFKLVYPPDLWRSFVILYRAVPGLTLNTNALKDVSNEKDVYVATQGAMVIAVWSGNGVEDGMRTQDYNIFFSISTDSGTSWTQQSLVDAVAVGDTLIDDTAPSASWAPGGHTVQVVWLAGSTEVKVATSSDLGSTWLVSTVAIARSGVSFSKPGSAFNGLAWVAVWSASNVYGSDSDILFSRSTNSNTWSTPRYIHAAALDDTGEDLRPSIASQGSVFTVSWESNSNLLGMLGTDYDVLISESTDGLTWTSPVGAVGGSDDHPSIVSDDTHATTFVIPGTNTRGLVRLSETHMILQPSVLNWGFFTLGNGHTIEQCPNNPGWSSPALVDDKFFVSDSGSDTDVDIAVGDSSIMLTWESSNPLGNTTAFPVSGLYLRFPFRTLTRGTTTVQDDRFVNVVHLSTTVSDDTGKVSLTTIDDTQSAYKLSGTSAPLAYDSLLFYPDGTFPDEPTTVGLRSTLRSGLPSTEFSIAVWIKNTVIGQGALICFMAMLDDGGDRLARISFSIVDGGNTILHRSSLDLAWATKLDLSEQLGLDASWHHYVAAFDVSSALISVFIDGNLKATANLGQVNQVLPSNGFFWVGSAPVDKPLMYYNYALYGIEPRDDSQIFKGAMADLMIFNRILSASESASIMALTITPPATKLRYAWALTAAMSWRPSAWANPTSSDGRDRASQIVAASPTTFSVVYETTESSFSPTGSPVLVNSVFANGTWSSPRTVSSSGGEDKEFNRLLCGSNQALIFSSKYDFTGTTGYDADIWITFSTDGFRKWTDPAVVNSNAESDTVADSEPMAIFKDGVGIVVWVQYDSASSTSSLYVSRSFDQCRTWSEMIPTGAASASDSILRNSPILIARSTNILLLFLRKSPSSATDTDTEIAYTQTDPQPSFFCTANAIGDDRFFPASVDTDDWIRDAVMMSLGKHRWIVAYTKQDPSRMKAGGADLVVAHYDPISRSWNESSALVMNSNASSTLAVSYLRPSLARSNVSGVVILVWTEVYEQSATAFVYMIRSSLSMDNGTSWGAASTVYMPPTMSAPIDMPVSISASNGDVFLAVWHVSDNTAPLMTGSASDSDIIFSQFSLATQKWTKPAVLNQNFQNDIGDDMYPAASFNSLRNEFLVAWESTTDLAGIGSDKDILFSVSPFINLSAFCAGVGDITTVTEYHEDKYNGLSIASAADNILVAWHSKHNSSYDGKAGYSTDSDIFVSWSMDGGVTFTSTSYAIGASVTDGKLNDWNPKVVFAGTDNKTSVFVLAWLTDSQSSTSFAYDVNTIYLTNASCVNSAICLNSTHFAPSENVTKLTSTPVDRASFPSSLAVASNSVGYVVIAWIDSSVAGGTRVRLRSSTDYGRTWSVSMQMRSTSPASLFNPHVTLTSSTMIISAHGVALDGTSSLDFDVFAWRASANTSLSIDRWDWRSVSLSNRVDIGEDVNITTAAIGTRWVAVWQSNERYDLLAGTTPSRIMSIIFSVSNDDGQTWSRPAPLWTYDYMFEQKSPRVAVNSDGIFVVGFISSEFSLTGNDLDLFVSESANGEIWSEPRALNRGFDSDAGDESDLAVFSNPRSKKFVTGWTCCKAGSATLSVARWSSLLNAASCPKVEGWSQPMAMSSLAALDGTSVDSKVSITMDAVRGDTSSFWQSTATTLDPRIRVPDLMLWLPLTRSFSAMGLTSEVDASGNGRTGTVNGVSSLQADTHFPNSGVVLQLTQGSTSAPISAFPTDKFTVSLWTKLSSPPPPTQTIFSKTNNVTSTTSEFSFFATPPGVGLSFVSDFFLIDSDRVSLLDGKWHHIALTYIAKSSTITIYIDGISVFSKVRVITMLGSGQLIFSPVGMLAHAKLFSERLSHQRVLEDAMDFETISYSSVSYGSDFDIQTVRRRDDGTWTNPEYINSNAATDAVDDTDVTAVYTNKTGLWTTVWLTRDADTKAFAVKSGRVGMTGAWSSVSSVTGSANTEIKMDRSLSIATDGYNVRGVAVSGTGPSLSVVKRLYIDPNVTERGASESATTCAGATFGTPSVLNGVLSNIYNLTHFRSVSVLPLPNGLFFAIFEGLSFDSMQSAIYSAVFTSGDVWQPQLLRFVGANTFLSISAIIGGDAMRDVTCAVNEDGVVIVAWVDLVGGQWDKYMVMGTTTSDGVLLSSAAHAINEKNAASEFGLSASVGKYNAFDIFWWVSTSTSLQLKFSTSDMTDTTLTTWSTPVLVLSSVTSANFGSYDPFFTTTYDKEDTYLVVFHASNVGVLGAGTDMDIYLTRSVDAGATWSSPSTLNSNARYDGAATDLSPRVVFSDGLMMCVWYSTASLRTMIGADNDVLFSVSSDLGQTWTDPLPVNTDAMTDTFEDIDPSIECDGTFCIVAWTRSTKGGDKDVFFSETESFGATWTNPRYLSASMRTDSSDDGNARLFVNQGMWGVSMTTTTGVAEVPSFSLFSGRRFFNGRYSNAGTSDVGAATSISISGFGRKILVKTASDSLRIGDFSYVEPSISATADANSTISMTFTDTDCDSAYEGLVSVTGNQILTVGLSRGLTDFDRRWDFGAAVVRVTNPVSQSVDSLLVVQGGNTVGGYTSSIAIHEPISGIWEQVICSSGSIPRLYGHTALSYSTQSGNEMVIYGQDLVSNATLGRIYFISNILRTETSTMFGRAQATCASPTATGAAPTWNRNQKIVILTSYLFVVDSSASSQELFRFDLKTPAWSRVPSVHNPLKTVGAFGVFINNAVLYVLSTENTLMGLKSTDFNRINPAKCVATSPFGDFLSQASAGQRAVIDVTARTSLDTLVSSGSDLDVQLVSPTTGVRIRGKYQGSPTLGVFRFSFSATTPGKYELRITAFDVIIGPTASVFSVEITPGTASYLTAIIDQTGLSQVLADVPNTFKIYVADAFGNPVLGGDDVKVLVAIGNSDGSKDTNVAKVVDNVDGSYSVSFTVTKAGNYTVQSLLNNVELQQSPFYFQVSPGPPQGSLSTTQGTDTVEAPSGKGGALTVTAVDSSGNPLTKGLGADAVEIVFFEASNRRATGLTQVDPQDVTTQVVDNGDGTYRIEYFPFIDGKFSYSIKIKGVPVKGSPFPLEVKPVFATPDYATPVRNIILVIAVVNFLGACCHVGMLRRYWKMLNHLRSKNRVVPLTGKERAKLRGNSLVEKITKDPTLFIDTKLLPLDEELEITDGFSSSRALLQDDGIGVGSITDLAGIPAEISYQKPTGRLTAVDTRTLEDEAEAALFGRPKAHTA